VLPVYVPPHATKWSDVIATFWEILAAVNMAMDGSDICFTFKRYILVVCLNIRLI